jgi:hypothetical protein
MSLCDSAGFRRCLVDGFDMVYVAFFSLILCWRSKKV